MLNTWLDDPICPLAFGQCKNFGYYLDYFASLHTSLLHTTSSVACSLQGDDVGLFVLIYSGVIGQSTAAGRDGVGVAMHPIPR